MTVNSSYLRNVGYSSLIYQVLIVAYVFSYLIIFYNILFFIVNFFWRCIVNAVVVCEAY